jgi:hypothetical protein
MLTPDSPQANRRQLAAMVVTHAAAIEMDVASAVELGCRVPRAINAMPTELRRFAASIERTRP